MSASATPHRPVTSPPPDPKRAKILKCETCRHRKVKCEPQDRNWSNQEKCKPCQEKGRPCGPNVPCPPKPGSAAPNTNQASAPSYAAVLSSPAPRLAMPRNGAASRPSTTRLRPPSGPNLRVITSSTTATRATNNQITDSVNGRLSFIASKLRTLGNVRELFQKFVDYRRTIGPESGPEPFLRTQSHSESCICHHCSALSEILTFSIAFFTLHLSKLQEILGLLDLHCAEKNLLRVSRIIETFLDATRSYITQDDRRLGDINAIYRDINGRLLKISIEQGDHAEAGRLRQILAKHDPEVASQLADLLSLSDTSKRMRSTFNMLELPTMVQQAFRIFTTDELCPPLHIALNYRIILSTDQLQAIPDQSLQATDLLRRNAVHIAAATSQAEFLRDIRLRLTDKLLEARDIFGNTPLMVAAYHDDYNSFQILWDTGVGHEVRDLRSRSIMAIACFSGSREIVKFLMLRNVSPYDRCVYDGHGALYVAAARNHLGLCKMLLEYDQTPGEFTQLEKNEAIRVAEENHHTEILLLLHGYTTHAANLIQYSPDSTQPGHSSLRQEPSVLEHPGSLQPQCPQWPTGSSTGVPTPGQTWNWELDNLMPDEWERHEEFNSNLPRLPGWNAPTFNN